MAKNCKLEISAGEACPGKIAGDGLCDYCGREPVVAASKAKAQSADSAAQGSSATQAPAVPVPGFQVFSGSMSTRLSTFTGRGKGTQLTRRGREIGAGLIDVEPMPIEDPLNLVMDKPTVPDGKRVCQNHKCYDRQKYAEALAMVARLKTQDVLAELPFIGKEPRGFDVVKLLSRLRGEALSDSDVQQIRRLEQNRAPRDLLKQDGFCGECRQPYNFKPSLKKGDVVAGQYEVAGPIAFGGLGWIYLAKDTSLDRWVVMKGLLNREDEGAARVALLEKEFLSRLDHPQIVKIMNWVTNKKTEPFIVMELVNGRSLKDVRKAEGPMHPAKAIAYILAVMPAMGYLHSNELLYCDFKIDQVMLHQDRVKLIDLGAVLDMNHPEGDIYGTVGYTAPEAGETPSITTDLYTIGRALAVLIMNFDYQGQFLHSLPHQKDIPVLAKHDCLYRFLRKATADKPEDRFQSMDDMEDQLQGVLRQVVACEFPDKKLRPCESNLFGEPGDQDYEKGAKIETLPPLKMDASDPAAIEIMAVLDGGNSATILEALRALRKKNKDSIELALRLAKFNLASGETSAATRLLDSVQDVNPGDWRITWYRGLCSLAKGKFGEARKHFQEVYDALPGELAPQLALAMAIENEGKDTEFAARLLEVISLTNPRLVSAAFALARIYKESGQFDKVDQAYARVPSDSRAFVSSRLQLAQFAVHRAEKEASSTNLQEALLNAAKAIEALGDGQSKELLEMKLAVLIACIQALDAHKIKEDRRVQVFGVTLSRAELRKLAELACRGLARHETDRAQQVAWIETANQFRPFTLF